MISCKFELTESCPKKQENYPQNNKTYNVWINFIPKKEYLLSTASRDVLEDELKIKATQSDLTALLEKFVIK